MHCIWNKDTIHVSYQFGNDYSTSQISVGCIGLFDNNTENIVAMYRISVESIDDTYRIRSVKRYRVLMVMLMGVTIHGNADGCYHPW